MMKNPVLIPELRELLKKKKNNVLKAFISERHPKDISEYISLLEPDEIWRILSLTDLEKGVEIFGYMDMDVQVRLVSGEMKKNITELLKAMSHDDRADLFQNLDKNTADRLLVLLPISERADVLKLTSYSEETAGAIMTTDYATLNEKDTVEGGIKKVRKMAPSKETIYYIYVTDDNGRLIGFVSLRNMILARPKQLIGSIMKREMIFAYISDDQEKAARLIDEFDLIALPIVDRNMKLSGIITYDDAIDIIREEQTEDMEKLMAISGGVEDKPYLDVPAYTHFKKRAFWVLILGVFGIFTGLIIQVFQKTLETLIILSFYIPFLTAAGGNTGSQSATVILRSLTLKELTPRDFFRVLRKEFAVSALISISLGIMTFFRVILFSRNTHIPDNFMLLPIAVTIAISLTLQVIWSTIFGALIPLFATKLKLDPAVVSSPLLTTCVDMSGVVIYFTAARLILGI